MSIYSTNILSVGLSVRLQKANELRYYKCCHHCSMSNRVTGQLWCTWSWWQILWQKKWLNTMPNCHNPACVLWICILPLIFSFMWLYKIVILMCFCFKKIFIKSLQLNKGFLVSIFFTKPNLNYIMCIYRILWNNCPFPNFLPIKN